MIRRMLPTLILLAALPAFAQEPKPPPLTPDEQKLADDAATLDEEAMKLHQRGQPDLAIVKVRQALAIYQQIYPKSKYPDGHTDLANSLAGVGITLQAMGQPEQALPFHQQGLTMNQRLFPASKFPDGHVALSNSLNNMGFVLKGMGQAEQSLPYFRQALDMRRRLYPVSQHPDGHAAIALSLNNLGVVLHGMGQAEQALPLIQQCLVMSRRLVPQSKFPEGHPDIAQHLNNLGGIWMAMGQAEKSLASYEQCLEMRRKLYPAAKYPDGHPDLANSLNNLAYTLHSAAQAEKAAPLFQQGLEMRQKLYPASKYPNGHPDLANSLNNLGYVLEALGQLARAETYVRQSFEMKQRLFPESRYPDGHPELATGLQNIGSILKALGQLEKAAPYYQQSLEMVRKLYPTSKYPAGHPQLALGLHNVGLVQFALGQLDQAVTSFQQATEMYQQLYPKSTYPDGHSNLARSLDNWGNTWAAKREAKTALPLMRQSVLMLQAILNRELPTASEEAAFERVKVQIRYRDKFLSVTRTLDIPAGESYQSVWPSRAMVTRLLEQRNALARAGGAELAAKLDQLRGNRRRTEQLLQDARMKRAERDHLLAQYADERDTLERELLAASPTRQRWNELDRLGPADLVEALSPGSVFVDFIAYARFEYPNGKVQQIPNYVAFVLARGQPIQRVELGEAAPIDSAVRLWRTAIESGCHDLKAVAELSRLVWHPLARHLPHGTTKLYLATDGDLARVPWAALPFDKGRALIEEYALAVVPHGMFLLDHLRHPRTFAGPEKAFALGGVDYGAGIWPPLPGTLVETTAIASLAPGGSETVRGKDATVEQLSSRLAKARYAHLATHGEFRAEALSAERRLAVAARQAQVFGDDSRKVAANNPLGYVGLVLAGGEIMSGLGIVDLNLENLKLVTLSACETGLGEFTGGEGVQGLQRVFHLAGCPNVVASLWKVNDAATAALMVKFYHELWVNKKPPIEALREAQLTIYRRPDLIATLASAERGIKLEQALNVKSDPPAESKGTTPTKLWAAFVLSGVGR